MFITEYEHWLVVRQSRRRRIYRVTLVATVSRTLRTPLGARARKRGGFMQLRWFHIRGVCIAPGCVYRSSSARRDMGIPGDRIKRVETYQVGIIPLRRENRSLHYHDSQNTCRGVDFARAAPVLQSHL